MAIARWFMRIAVGLSLMVPLSGTSSATPLLFDYGNTTSGTTVTPFLQTVGGVTATFSSDQDPGGFEVDSSFAATFSGQIVDTSFGNATLATNLQIAFNAPIASISLPFLTDGSGPLELQAFQPEGPLIGSTSATGTVPSFPAQFPEGMISFSGRNIAAVRLTDPFDSAFAIGTLTVTLTTSVPEPTASEYLALGLAALGVACGVRRRAHVPRPRAASLPVTACKLEKHHHV
jgi:MYXO-CTERM domain-containing protein